ncbi:MAG: asparagine--tRNA ligase [Bdellovibrionaceae bacterium]|nr:asparagine--tRNA ligase [Pseudobdellovibrionaceae bacterium]|tara:strand:- start:189148 stop:190437 length:1290 start_codon:yes stop_codon:yes gene_type:complete
MRYFIEDLGKHVNETVELKGWAYNTRSSGKIKFLELRDGTGMVQCIYFRGECDESAFENFGDITQETSLKITGVVREHPKKPGVYEIGAQNFEIIGKSPEFPISPKEHGTDFLMNHRHLWLRSKRQHAAIRVRAEIIKSIRDFFDGRGFTLTDAPVFTPNACEGTTTLFETQYFDDKAYLSQSGQLYMEATAAAFGKVYCFGPTFRAEKSKTRRHLIEFWMVEPEVAFNDLYDNMDLMEQFVEYVVQRTITNKKEELEILERDVSKLAPVKGEFPRIHYKEAVEIIKKENPDFVDGDDFGGADETIISSQFEKPVMVHHYPTAIKAFYMKEEPKDATYSMSVDMLATEGYGEIIGGGQREDDLDIILRKIKEHDLDEKDFAWYNDIRKYGSFPHAGFGLGIERTVAWICGLSHVRETIPFPRMYGRMYP